MATLEEFQAAARAHVPYETLLKLSNGLDQTAYAYPSVPRYGRQSNETIGQVLEQARTYPNWGKDTSTGGAFGNIYDNREEVAQVALPFVAAAAVPSILGSGGTAAGGDSALYAGTEAGAQTPLWGGATTYGTDLAATDSALASVGGDAALGTGTLAGVNAAASGGASAAGGSAAGGGFFQNGNWVPTLVGGGLTILGMEQQKKAADEAAKLAGAATDKATAESARQFNIGQENLAPWLSAGKTALGASLNLQGLSGDPSSSLAALQSSPGYQFRLKQGRQGLDASSAARGGMGSGKAMTAASGWNQDFASNEYGNRLNQLAGLSNTGQTTGNQMANNGANYANNNANLLTNNAGYQGAAGMAGANARASGLYGLANLGINSWDKYRNA